jgi:uncharacterized surface protein with fasciclin (FAS1) repeats
VNSPNHTKLVAAVKAAGLVETLERPEPFTVFAPTNSAVDKLPARTVQTLLKPENKAALVKVLTYHSGSRPSYQHRPEEADRGGRRSGDAQDRES